MKFQVNKYEKILTFLKYKYIYVSIYGKDVLLDKHTHSHTLQTDPFELFGTARPINFLFAIH